MASAQVRSILSSTRIFGMSCSADTSSMKRARRSVICDTSMVRELTSGRYCPPISFANASCPPEQARPSSPVHSKVHVGCSKQMEVTGEFDSHEKLLEGEIHPWSESVHSSEGGLRPLMESGAADCPASTHCQQTQTTRTRLSRDVDRHKAGVS